ncbi:hypothetical protein CALCODRAFT_336655 [Calocera cornea HHB12733]|uniref:Uncharacterized protein n=1 Tax=Calocera cornea HHB12733 TaxID=1353952 RepID=A0A165F0S5_9BASI|nr:hypothetical protein CALCODRAFT_336655 [Calocera cornea HHB12733]
MRSLASHVQGGRATKARVSPVASAPARAHGRVRLFSPGFCLERPVHITGPSCVRNASDHRLPCELTARARPAVQWTWRSRCCTDRCPCLAPRHSNRHPVPRSPAPGVPSEPGKAFQTSQDNPLLSLLIPGRSTKH